jgi:hypothetical protein
LGQLHKIIPSKLAQKATFWDKGDQISTSKSHLLDKEIANFRSEKATFSDHPLHELPGAWDTRRVYRCLLHFSQQVPSIRPQSIEI